MVGSQYPANETGDRSEIHLRDEKSDTKQKSTSMYLRGEKKNDKSEKRRMTNQRKEK